MKLVPLGDRVVLKQCEKEETTKSGIILTAKAQEKPVTAEVVAVGPGGMVDGKEVTMQVKVGDQVIYSKYAGNEVMFGTNKDGAKTLFYQGKAAMYVDGGWAIVQFAQDMEKLASGQEISFNDNGEIGLNY